VDTTFEEFFLTQSALVANIFSNTTQFSITLPKDSSSNVQTIQDGYAYCKAERRLMASIDGGSAFFVTLTSQTI